MRLTERVRGALSLAPMTTQQLARCLCASEPRVRDAADRSPGVVRVGVMRSIGRPRVVYGLGR